MSRMIKSSYIDPAAEWWNKQIPNTLMINHAIRCIDFRNECL